MTTRLETTIRTLVQRKDERDVVTEILTAIKRAGADLVVTYHAKGAASWL